MQQQLAQEDKDWRMKMIRISAAVLMASLAMSQPLAAQESAGEKQGADEKINQLFVYGDDDCPESTGDEIVVCARLDEAERYRIPETLRNTDIDPARESWTKRVLAYEYVGADGTQSCSASGAGGFTGCGLNAIDQAFEEKKLDPGLVFGRLIAAKRAERLAGIDAEAAEVEERVKQFEKDRAAREAREEAARNGLDAADDAAAKEVAADADPLPEPL